MKNKEKEINNLLDSFRFYDFLFIDIANEEDLIPSNIIIRLNDLSTRLVIQNAQHLTFNQGQDIERDGQILDNATYDEIRTTLQDEGEVNDAALLARAKQQILRNLIQRRELEDREGFLREFNNFLNNLPEISLKLKAHLSEFTSLKFDDDIDIDTLDENDPTLKKLKELHQGILTELESSYRKEGEEYCNKPKEEKETEDADIVALAAPEFMNRYPAQSKRLERLFEILNEIKIEEAPEELAKIACALMMDAAKLQNYFNLRYKLPSKEEVQTIAAEISPAMMASSTYWYSDDDMDILGQRLAKYEINVEKQFKGRLTKDVINSLPVAEDRIDDEDDTIKGLEEGNPIFIAYNIGGSAAINGGIHWVAMLLVKHQGRVKVLYKDSKGDFGNNAAGIEAEFRAHYGSAMEFIIHIGTEQEDDSSCGPMTINNLEKIAEKLQQNGIDSLISGFQSISFTNQNEVPMIRAEHAGAISEAFVSNIVSSSREEDEDIRNIEDIIKELKLVDKNEATAKVSISDAIRAIDQQYNLLVKDWGIKELADWSIKHKGKLDRTSSEVICESVAVMERANELATGGHRLRDTQKAAIFIFMQTADKGHISQISTGEGKTTIVSFVQALKVMQGYKGHVITSNEVLAADGVKNKALFYQLLGISVAHNNHEEGYTQGPRACYTKDIVYGSINNFQFDWLRDSFERLETMKGVNFDQIWVMLDEIDSLLIDQGGNIAKLSGPFPGMESLRYVYINIWVALVQAETEVEEEILAFLKTKAEKLNEEERPLRERLLKTYGESPAFTEFANNNAVIQEEEENELLFDEQDPLFKKLVKYLELSTEPSIQSDTILLKESKKKNNEKYEDFEDALRETFLDKIKEKIIAQKASLINKSITAKHLHEHAEQSIDRWIEYAFSAKYQYNENVEYKTALDSKTGERVIIPVDNQNTGVSMKNTILSNGLHQFLQIKHNLHLTYESLTSSFVSNLGYILKHDNKLSGVTGTLGSNAERDLLGAVFNLGFSTIPTYKPKQFQVFPGQIAADEEFINVVATSALSEIIRERAVLIVCASIRDVKEIEQEIRKEAEITGLNHNIKIYSDEAEAHIPEKTLIPGDIVIATNIAGRGTDFKTSDELEDNGGLHVIETFLPCNKRVEDQGLGRTSRQGNYGTGQIIARISELEELGINVQLSDIKDHVSKMIEDNKIAMQQGDNSALLQYITENLELDLNKNPIEIDTKVIASDNENGQILKEDLINELYFRKIIRARDQLESERVANIRENKVVELKFMDQLFNLFSELHAGLKDEHKNDADFKWTYVLMDLKEKWAFWLEEQKYTPEKIKFLSGGDNAKSEFEKFRGLSAEIIQGNIKHNPYYSICLAERYLEVGDEENRAKAKVELDNALSIGNDSDLLYSAHMKLFEVAIENGGQTLERYKKAVAKVFFISLDKDETYKAIALDQLQKAEAALNKEYDYLKKLVTGKESDGTELNEDDVSPVLDSILIQSSTEGNEYKENIFVKHLQSRQTVLGIYLNNIKSLLTQMGETQDRIEGIQALREGIIIDTKVPRYLSKLDSKLEHEKHLKEIITDQEVNELEFVGMNSIIQLREVHDVPNQVIENAQWQIGGGLAALAITIPFPFLLPVNGPIAGTLIGEGITDIVMALIDQGQTGFNKQEYVKSKLIGYGISIVTMGIGAIASSTKILTKAMNACKSLANKLRAVEGPFAKVCNWMAKRLDKLANFLELSIKKIEFAKKSMDAQKQMLVDIQKEASAAEKAAANAAVDSAEKAAHVAQFTKLTKQAQQLEKGLKLSDIAITHSQKLLQIIKTTSIGALKGVAVSVAMEKIFTATLNKMMEGLKPQIEAKIKEKVTQRINTEQIKLNQYTKDVISKWLQVVFETSLGEDIEHVVKEISLGVLRHSNNWKMQLATLTIDSIISGVEIDTCADKICNKFFAGLPALPAEQAIHQHNYEQIINQLSIQITNTVYSKIVSITGKVASTLPKILYRGYKQHQEKKLDKQAVASIKQRIEEVNAAEKGATAKGTTCGHNAVTSTLGIDDEHLSHSSGLAMSTKGATKEEIGRLYEQNGIKTSECSETDAVTQIGNAKSDRAVACLKSADGTTGHAVPVTLENGQLMVTAENGQKITLEAYRTSNGYSADISVIVPHGINEQRIKDGSIQRVTNHHRIAKMAHPIDFVGKGKGDKFGGPHYKDRETGDKFHMFEVEGNKPQGILLESESNSFKHAFDFRDMSNNSLKGVIEKGMVMTLVECDQKGDIKDISIHTSGSLQMTAIQLQNYKESISAAINQPQCRYNRKTKDKLITMIDNLSLPETPKTRSKDKIHSCALDNAAPRALQMLQKKDAQGKHHIVIGGEVPITKELQKDYGIPAISCDSCHRATEGIAGHSLPRNTNQSKGRKQKTPKKNQLNAGDALQIYKRKSSIEYWLNYNNDALEDLLSLRLKSLAQIDKQYDIRILSAFEIADLNNNHLRIKLNKVIGQIKQFFYHVGSIKQTVLLPILIPQTEFVSHWVGLAITKNNNKVITLTYIDSENQLAPFILQNALPNELQKLFPHSKIIFKQQELETQRYNNCGSELIENFIYYLTGTRATQEAALYLHSLLYENSVLDPEFSTPQMGENNRLIIELSNQMRPIYYTPSGYITREFLFIIQFLLKNRDIETGSLVSEILDQEPVEPGIPETDFTGADQSRVISVIVNSHYNTNAQNKKPNLELAETMLNIRNSIEFVPVLSYFIKNIVYPISKDILPTELEHINLPEIHSSLLYAGHVGASYAGALALNIASPFESALTASSGYGSRLVFQKVVNNIGSFDLSNNINMAGYCIANTALHFTPELIQLYYFMNIGQFNYGKEITGNLLKVNTLTVIQRFTTSSLECYNTYKQVHHIEENIETKIENIFPYIADAIALGSSIAVSYNPFFIIGNIVLVDISSKVILKAIPMDIKTSFDLGLTCLGFTGDISNTFTNMYDIYWKGIENEHAIKTYQSCKALGDSFMQFNWLKNKVYDFESDSSYYSNKVIKILEVKKDQEAKENYNALSQEFGEEKAEYMFKYMIKPGLDKKYELLKQFALGVLTEFEYQEELQKINFSIDIGETHYDLCVTSNNDTTEDNNIVSYNCYSKENDIIDNIITDGAKLIGLNNLYSE